MDLRAVLSSNQILQNLILIGIKVILVAIVFEFVAWWLGRLIEKWTIPIMTLDAEREPMWRTRRRTTLRQTPKKLARALCYVAAFLVVLQAISDIPGLPIPIPMLPLALIVGVTLFLVGLATLPLLRDFAQGYALLAEDTLAIGDVVEIGAHRGKVEKLTLRGAWLRDDAGHLHCLSNRDVHDVVVHQRKVHKVEDELPPRTPARDGSAARAVKNG